MYHFILMRLDMFFAATLIIIFNSGRRLSPGKSCGPVAPAAARTVGTKSMDEQSSGRSAGLMVPGQRNMMGVRVPPS